MGRVKETLPAVPETLWQMCLELQTVTDKIIEQGGELLEGDLEALQAWQASVEVKAQNVAFFREANKGKISYFRAIEEAAKARRKAAEAAEKSVTQYLASCMSSAGIKKIKGDGLFTISLVDGRTSVQITDESKLPLDYVETVVVSKPLTGCIKAALEGGTEVPGAALETGQPYVMIRGGKPKEE